jgi:hypothetical protein
MPSSDVLELSNVLFVSSLKNNLILVSCRSLDNGELNLRDNSVPSMIVV